LRGGAAALLASAVLGGCGSQPQLKVRFFDDVQRGREVLISVPEDLNRPNTAHGAEQVRVQCFDRRGRTVTNELYAWPFVADGMGDRLPHVHQRGLPKVLNRVVRCRIARTDPPLAGELPLAR
jgi:hypothetical protein